MSENTVTCPACGVTRRTRQPLTGRKIRCKCGNVFKVGRRADDSTVVQRYKLKKALFGSEYTAHYDCPNDRCAATLRSPHEEIGVVDRCPTCGIPFRLDKTRLSNQLEADKQQTELKAERQSQAEEAKKARADEKQRKKLAAREERERQAAITRQRLQQEAEDREQALAIAEAQRQNTQEAEDGSGRETPRRPFRKVLIGVALLIIAAGAYAFLSGSKASLNPLQSLANSGLQSKLDRAIEFDHRNSGVEVSVYYKDSVGRGTIVFDLHEAKHSSKLDVFRVLLDFAEEVEDESFSELELAFRGKTKFKLDGYYVRKLGRERSFQNPNYMIRTFPENLETPYGTSAYSEWTGGILGVTARQLDDFNDFHDEWYANRI